MKEIYVFNIKEYIYNLTKEMPYMLYKDLYDVYKKGISLFNDNYYLNKFNKKRLNEVIYDSNKEYRFYKMVKQKHLINNKYSLEKTLLDVKSNYLVIYTNNTDTRLLKVYEQNSHLFAIDFTNKNYFWLHI